MDVILINGVGWIGKKIAHTLAQNNCHLFLVDRSTRAIEQCIKDLRSNNITTIITDLNSEESNINIVKTIKQKFGKLDVLIHTAAIYPRTLLTEISLDEWMDVLNTNLTSAFLAIKHTNQLMINNNFGRIVLFSSTTGVNFGVPGFSHYSATKAAIEGLVKTLAIELSAFGITINAVCPGNIINQELYNITPAERKHMENGIPVKRLGNPEDLAHLINFLISKKTDFITGQSFRIDGGETLLPKADFIDIK